MKDNNNMTDPYYKKRIIFAILITIVVIILTNKIWLICSPIHVGLDIKGGINSKVKVLLNKKNDDNFEKFKQATVGVVLNENNHIDLDIKRIFFPKRIKIIISKLKPGNEITLSNIKVKKLNIDDLEKFNITGANAIVKDKSLIIKPNIGTVSLIYPEKLNIRASIKLDFTMFIIIAILTFLLVYKLISYIADYKAVYNKSQIDIIFLTIFFISLFLPMCHISKKEISEKENRILARWYPLIKEDKTINFDFGKNFNDWFSDRFFLRNAFLSLNDMKLVALGYWEIHTVIKGKDNWLFFAGADATESYTNSKPLTQEELEKIYRYIKNLDDYCKKHNKKFYMFIAPDKSKVYEEYYTDKIKKVHEESKTDQLLKYMKEHSDVKIIYPREKLISLKGKDLLYWKQDSHWNSLGAYYGYLELMDVIRKDFKDIEIFHPQEYFMEKNLGDLYRILPKIAVRKDNTDYKVPVETAKYSHLVEKDTETSVNQYYNPQGKYNLVMYRDSFTIFLLPYLVHSFKDSKFMWKHTVISKEMEDADIVIFEMVERFLPNLKNYSME